jgi:hypothetical protein
MEIYTVEEYQERWDEMIVRVENGEHIGITNGENTAIMVSSDDEVVTTYMKCKELL